MLRYDIINCIGANAENEIDTVYNKFQESENDISCITDHEGCMPECVGSTNSLFQLQTVV